MYEKYLVWIKTRINMEYINTDSGLDLIHLYKHIDGMEIDIKKKEKKCDVEIVSVWGVSVNVLELRVRK